MGAKCNCTIVPLVYFGAQWEEDFIEFSPGARLLRAYSEGQEQMATALEDVGAPDGVLHLDGPNAIRNDAPWWLVSKFLYVSTDSIVNMDSGKTELFASLESVHELFTRSFLSALSIVRPNCAMAPVVFSASARFTEDATDVDEIGDIDPFNIGDFREPPCHECAACGPFGGGDIGPLHRVWEGIAELRNLKRKASVLGEEAVPPTLEELHGQSAELGRRARAPLLKALGCFETGLRLDRREAFKRMCNEVLQALFVTDYGKVTKQVVDRIAGLHKSDAYRQLAENVLRTRGNLEHGGMLTEDIKDENLQAAFALARES